MPDVFTPDEVEALSNWQERTDRHPFTCANRADGRHHKQQGGRQDLGVLVPTVRGWICPYCDYTQDWAHDFMKVRSEPRPLHGKRGRTV